MKLLVILVMMLQVKHIEVKIEGQNFSAKGAKGSDSYVVPEGITAAVEGIFFPDDAE